MVLGVNMSHVGRDITRGAVNELKRQVKQTTRQLNPMSKIRNLKAVKRIVDVMTKKGKGRRRGRRPHRVGRGRRAPPPFFKGSGRRTWV